MILWYKDTNAEERKPAPSRRAAAGHAGFVDSPDAHVGTGARAHHRSRHRASIGGRAADRARLALPGAPSSRGPRLDRVLLGNVRQQSEGALLPPDPGRPPAVRGTNHEVGPSGALHRTDSSAVDRMSRELATLPLPL